MRLGVLVLFISLISAHSALALDVRFYPGARVYAYELDAAHGARSVIVHNIAVINDTAAPLALHEVDIELMAGDRPLDRRTLDETELTRMAASGAGLQQAGMLPVLAFQFGGDRLLPANT